MWLRRVWSGGGLGLMEFSSPKWLCKSLLSSFHVIRTGLSIVSKDTAHLKR